MEGLFFSNTLQEKLKKINACSLSVLEAPAGYGKTTAIRRFLQDSGASVCWYTAVESMPDTSFRWFVRQLSTIDENAARMLQDMGYLNRSNADYAAQIISEIKASEPLTLVFDNFQFALANWQPQVLDSLAKCGDKGLRAIFISQNFGRLREILSALEGSICYIRSRDLLLSERFDRATEGKRIHFASAMSLLGLDDGAGSSTGNGYLDIVDFILQGCTDIRQNLRELYRRVAFNIMFGNTDDHFRNHGFLLTPKGWTLSPAYDINPSAKSHQCLLIDQYTEQSDVNALFSASENYMLERQEAAEIMEEVRAAIKDWRKTATELQISLKLLESYSMGWDEL